MIHPCPHCERKHGPAAQCEEVFDTPTYRGEFVVIRDCHRCGEQMTREVDGGVVKWHCGYCEVCSICGERDDPDELLQNNAEPAHEGCREVFLGRLVGR